MGSEENIRRSPAHSLPVCGLSLYLLTQGCSGHTATGSLRQNLIPGVCAKNIFFSYKRAVSLESDPLHERKL